MSQSRPSYSPQHQLAVALEQRPPNVSAGIKIVIDVAVYRLRRLEMANLAAATSLALALRLPFTEIVYRTIFAFLLNVLVYLNNDYIDLSIDEAASDKDAEKTRFLRENARAALWAQWALVALLCIAALAHDASLLVALFVGGGVCWWYSAKLKRTPFTDIPAMMVWGLTMPLCGFPLEIALGWALGLQLALFSGVFETIQVIRDADEDAAEGVRTTAVVLGTPKTLWLCRVIMVASTVYALAMLHPIGAVISAAALAIPFTANDVSKYWTRVKLVYGITWLFVCAWVFLNRESAGLLSAIDSTVRLF